MKDDVSLWAIALLFGSLSLVAVGGANVVVPEMHRQAVDIGNWMSDTEFANLYAIVRAAPGPNMLIATMIGWKAAGLPGAVVATVAMCGPSCLLTYGVTRVWQRYQHTRWRAAVEAGLAPVTVGLVLASAYVLTRAADADWRAVAVTAVTAVVALGTRLNALWVLATAGVLGAAGLL
ncbi:MAG TPA: chromate transporter [Stellaceae bacterium]|nr:chromate transporter [Stellaceae bacterium]